MKTEGDEIPVAAKAYGRTWIESAWGTRGNVHAEALRPRPRVARALELVEPKPGMRLLDIACGRGELPAFVRNAGGWAIGLDFSPEVLKIARALRDTPLTADAGAMHLVGGDAAQLPFASGTFDRVTMLDIVEHLTPRQLDSMFAEVRRVLAVGGYAVIHTLPNRWLYEFTYPMFRWLLPGLPHNPRSAIEESVHINEQDIGTLGACLDRARLEWRVWLEQLMPAQARWARHGGGYGDQRDRIYPALAGWPGRLLELLSRTPARILIANDIFAIAWRDKAPVPRVRMPQGLTERLLLRWRKRQQKQGRG